VATRKISDLTLLGADQVSSSDTLLLLDNSDPTDQNKRSAVGSIFTAVPSGTYSAPGVRFESKTKTGVFSETQGQVGLALGDSRLNLQKVGTTLNMEARDDADQNLDFKLSAQGTGKIRLGSVLAINDLNFIVPNSVDETKVAKFSSTNLTSGLTNTYVFPSLEGQTNTTDELVTLKTTQTLENKTLASPVFTGSLSIESFTSSGSATIGDSSADSLTINAAATFAASTTFSNTLIISQGATITGDLTVNDHIDMVDDKEIKLGDDDDLVLKHYTSGVSMLRNTGVILGIYSDNLSLYNADVSINFATFSAAGSVIKHVGTDRITTTTTGITIGGAIDAVTSITGSGDITIATDKFTLDSSNGNAVFGGNITGGGDITATAGTTFQLGSTASAKLGIGRAASTYNLEVEGSIYSTGSTIIAGNGSAGKFILQKGAVAIGTHFTNNVGTDEMILDANANLGIGKAPGQRLDVSGNANIDGDLVVVTTNPSNNTGGKISAREVVLTDPITGSQSTLNYATSGGVSRARVFFTNM
jgi:hypothetical protein